MDRTGKYSIPVTNLGPGNHHFTMEAGTDFFASFGGTLVQGGNIDIEIDAKKGAAGLAFDFSITGNVVAECDRCLEPLTLPVEYNGRLTVSTNDELQGECDGDVAWIGRGDTEIDLSQYIYESVCLSLPLINVHGTDDEGHPLCNPDMIARFSTESSEEIIEDL